MYMCGGSQVCLLMANDPCGVPQTEGADAGGGPVVHFDVLRSSRSFLVTNLVR
jgi:hypothetical protein